MNLLSVRAHAFRNFSQCEIPAHPQYNIIVGPNGSGKTSLLESIYILLNGKSFRESTTSNLIKKGEKEFTVFGILQSEGITRSIAIQKSLHSTLAKLNGKRVRSMVEIARLAPVQLIHPESQRIINGGPADRRKFLDWGVFHVEHVYPDVYKEFKKVLKQRNAALQQKLDRHLVQAWDASFIELAEELHLHRAKYLTDLLYYVRNLLSQLISLSGIKIDYLPGWDEQEGLKQQLKQSWAKDCKLQYTGVGPQRADIVLETNGVGLEKWCSRGQQKIVAAALLLAQLIFLKENCAKTAILLVDDLPAELDEKNRVAFLSLLEDVNCQTFITATHADLLNIDHDASWFHVEHGVLGKAVV